MTKKDEFKEVTEENIKNEEFDEGFEGEPVEKESLFSRIAGSAWIRKIGWGLLTVAIATAGAALLSGLGECEDLDEKLFDFDEGSDSGTTIE